MISSSVVEAVLEGEEAGDENLLLDLTTRLPPQELWIEEQVLGILVLG